MIGFDTHRKKLKRAKKVFNFKKNSNRIRVSKILSINPSPRLEKFCWPVTAVKLRKGQKSGKFLEIANFKKILLKFKTLKS